MVSINLYQLIDKMKKEINRRLEEISVETNPGDFAWLLYALQSEKDTSLFLENFNRLIRWAHSNVSGENDRDIGALAMHVFFRKKFYGVNDEAILNKIEVILRRNIEKVMFKYSLLNNPSEMFLLSLATDSLNENLKGRLSEVVVKNINGTLSRKILFLAASINLGIENDKTRKIIDEILSTKLERIEDMMTLVWFLKKYKNSGRSERIPEIWNEISKEVPVIEKENGRISLPTRTLALIYEALNLELQSPDPLFVFSLYPFDHDIRKICDKYIKHEEYSTAVSETLKKLLEFLKESAIELGDKDIVEKIEKLETKERELIRSILNPRVPQNFKERKVEEIPIKFGEQIDVPPWKNLQEGLALMLEGLWVAFRHPEAHYPVDHKVRKLEPYETISVLIIIDYLWKRIKKSKDLVNNHDKPT